MLKPKSMTFQTELCAAWRSQQSLSAPLFELVEFTRARAAGCWRIQNEKLELVGFGSAKDMPLEVSQGFQDATRHVSLDQTNLGIVQAAISRKPVIAYRDPGDTGLDGSASWIVKFAANSSLAVPFFNRQQTLIGALAVSTVSEIQRDDLFWKTIVSLSELLGSAD